MLRLSPLYRIDQGFNSWDVNSIGIGPNAPLIRGAHR